jgi:hypothetical protein
MQNNASTTLSTTLATDPTGAFSGGVVFPTAVSGTSTLVATCQKSGDTINSLELNFSPATTSSNQTTTTLASLPTATTNQITKFEFGTNPLPGVTIPVSGNCSNDPGNKNGPVNFSISRQGPANPLTATSNVTDSGALFNSSVFFPTSAGTDPATFAVTCPNSSAFSNVIMMGTQVAGASISSPLAASVNATPPNTTKFPVGGVAAGFGPQTKSNNPILAEILLIFGLTGLFIVNRKHPNGQK